MIRWPDAASAGRRMALLVLGALVWEAAARSGAFSPLVVPSIARIGRELWWLVVRPESLADAWFSLQRAIVGLALAALVGVALGVLMGRSSIAAACLGPIFSGTYPIPKIALFPVFIYLFGIGSLSKVLLIFLECLYPIVVTTHAGSRAVNRVLVWSASNMGASRACILWRVVVPAAAPFIFAGFRVALPIAMIG
jgi:ABC-type nitrate/sulfonate/bicarbonate transport system permease component